MSDDPEVLTLASFAGTSVHERGLFPGGPALNAILIMSFLASIGLGILISDGRAHAAVCDIGFAVSVSVFLTTLIVAVSQRVVPELRAELRRGRSPR